MSTATFIQDETEFNQILKTASVMVVDCTAEWCGPCKLIAPLIDRLSVEYTDRVKVMKLDLPSNHSLAGKFGITSIPAILFFKQGELVETLVGVQPYEKFSVTLDQLLA
jgi:thioredoxin 1